MAQLDLMAETARLMEVASPSHGEGPLADHVEARLREVGGLDVVRIADNVIARTDLGRPQRVILAGHLDTVPANGNAVARRDGDMLWGLGAADMKGGLAVMLTLATSRRALAVDVTYVFYAAEEVARKYNGLLAVDATRPDLLRADAAILGEPTGAIIEAGCQGVLKLEVTIGGRRAHTARSWMGINAVHRLEPLLRQMAAFDIRRPVIDGCQYHESLEAVAVSGGIAGNVVPDRATLSLSHRFAPDRSPSEAEARVRQCLSPCLDPAMGDRIDVVEVAPAAPPGLSHPLLAVLNGSIGVPARAKLGWTDVAFFAERGIPAVNFGPGDPEVAHTADERVSRADLEAVHVQLLGLLTKA